MRCLPPIYDSSATRFDDEQQKRIFLAEKTEQMIKVTLCMGSACFIKGSKAVADRLMYLVEKHNLKDKVDLRGAFCMGKCAEGVSVEVNGVIFSVSPLTVDSFFNDKILAELKNEI